MSDIPASDMRRDEYYRVTRASTHLEFQVGDEIRMCADGCIENRQAEGWIEPDDVAEATQGMRCSVDHARRQRMIERLQNQIIAMQIKADK